ncbi:hypothetical protein OC834_001340, partial [Tilletia horrida]
MGSPASRHPDVQTSKPSLSLAGGGGWRAAEIQIQEADKTKTLLLTFLSSRLKNARSLFTDAMADGLFAFQTW